MALAAVGVRQGDRPPPGDGGDLLDRARARSTWSPPPASPTPTGCRCCCCPATRSPGAGRTRCCSRWSTTTTRRRRSTTPSARCPRYFDRITPPRAAARHAAAGGPGAHRPGGRRSRRAGPAAGRAGRGVRLPAGDVRRAAAPGAAAAAGRRGARRGGADPARGAASAAGRRRRRALLGGRRARCSAFAEAHGVPVVETPAGRTLIPHDHPLHGGPLGIIGSTSANTLAARGGRRARRGHPAAGLHDVLLDGVRATASTWSRSTPRGSTPSSTPRTPSSATPAATLDELDAALDGWRADAGVDAPAPAASARRGTPHVDRLRAGVAPDGSLTYAQVVGVVNEASGPGRLRADLVRRLPRASCTGAGGPDVRGRPDDGPRVRVLVHGLRGRRPVGRRHGPGARRTRTGWSPACSATART